MPRLVWQPRHKRCLLLQKCHRVFICSGCAGTETYIM